ncbi:hypothetical protein COO60DRAFT_388809 [Scenedesmus sp. NREL 46B-D3]|nr:hypothetical protein COO60DRAFT_388809 [Scenedesmus sp. NREL 46B-D3]
MTAAKSLLRFHLLIHIYDLATSTRAAVVHLPARTDGTVHYTGANATALPAVNKSATPYGVGSHVGMDGITKAGSRCSRITTNVHPTSCQWQGVTQLHA